VESRTQIELPARVARPFEVFVNGIPQTEGTDYELVGSSLVFAKSLEREGPLGFWRWARMALGIAGTYKKNDTVDVVFTYNGRRTVVSLAPPPREQAAEPAS
jgi:hypothetical protein